MTAPAATRHVRLTVHAAHMTLDLAMPADQPLRHHRPHILHALGIDPAAPITLTTAAGTIIDPDQTPYGLGIKDADILVVHDPRYPIHQTEHHGTPASTPVKMVDDVRDTIEDLVDAARKAQPYQRRYRHLAIATVGAIGVTIATLLAPAFLPVTASRIATTVAVLLIGVTPRLALAVSGLMTLDQRHRAGTPVETTAIRQRVARAHTAQLLSLAGLCLAVTVADVHLTKSSSILDQILATTAALALLIQTRRFTHPHLVVMPLATGTILLIANLISWTLRLQGAVPGSAGIIALAGTAIMITTGAVGMLVLNPDNEPSIVQMRAMATLDIVAFITWAALMLIMMLSVAGGTNLPNIGERL